MEKKEKRTNLGRVEVHHVGVRRMRGVRDVEAVAVAEAVADLGLAPEEGELVVGLGHGLLHAASVEHGVADDVLEVMGHGEAEEESGQRQLPKVGQLSEDLLQVVLLVERELEHLGQPVRRVPGQAPAEALDEQAHVEGEDDGLGTRGLLQLVTEQRAVAVAHRVLHAPLGRAQQDAGRAERQVGLPHRREL